MDGILSPAEVGHLTLLRAMVDPGALKTSIEQILKVQAEAEAALRDLREQEAKNAAILKEANRKVSEAAEMAAGAEALRRELAVKEKNIGEVQTVVNSEKAALEGAHGRLEAEYARRHDALAERETAASQMEVSAAAKEAKLAAEAKRLADLSAHLSGVAAKLRDGVGSLTAALDDIV